MLVMKYSELEHRLRPDGVEMTEFFGAAGAAAGAASGAVSGGTDSGAGGTLAGAGSGAGGSAGGALAGASGALAGAGVQMGLGVFPPGMEAPPAIHSEDEYAFVLSGTVKARVNGAVCVAEAGSATFIPAGEEHVSFNDGPEECRVVWMLVARR
ncbi:MAG: cupin domain-containing protein [Clostridiales Family XIII bacterium]|jgi:quercetin dioxygenase-like cupin family protein|nr:cupin domain-containing protein [Clostridiales Family XIII bacterium]